MGCSGNAEQNAGLKFGRSPGKQNGQVMNLERRTTRRGSIENEEGTQQAFTPTQQNSHRTENHAPRGIIFSSNLAKFFRTSKCSLGSKKTVKHGDSCYCQLKMATDDLAWRKSLEVFNQKLANGSCHQAGGPLSFRLVAVAATLFAEHLGESQDCVGLESFSTFHALTG